MLFNTKYTKITRSTVHDSNVTLLVCDGNVLLEDIEHSIVEGVLSGGGGWVGGVHTQGCASGAITVVGWGVG